MNDLDVLLHLISRLPRNERINRQAGSFVRMALLTHGSRKEVAERINPLLQGYATIGTNDYWMPRGLIDYEEAQLGVSEGFLAAEQKKEIQKWWLHTVRNANTPNWDFVSTCRMANGKAGLVLIEAKAHVGEFESAGKKFDVNKGNENNHKRIGLAIDEARSALNSLLASTAHISGQFGIKRDSYYQLSNRFAFGWKLAAMGVPVLLVYLGFLNASEMAINGKRTIFESAQDWINMFARPEVSAIVPNEIWGLEILVNGTPLKTCLASISDERAEYLQPVSRYHNNNMT